jgi:hypothetical protein
MFLSFRNYDPGCSSRIRTDFFPFPDPGVKKAPDPGSGIRSTGKTDAVFKGQCKKLFPKKVKHKALIFKMCFGPKTNMS